MKTQHLNRGAESFSSRDKFVNPEKIILKHIPAEILLINGTAPILFSMS